jgi:hypothetical protein
MAISTEFNYADKLALDKARLISRSRLNDLGSYELVIQYNNIPSTMREDALEWLEANRLQLTNPTFSFKTYEGEWDCASITYDEARAVLRQLFKLDVGVGNLGDTDSEPDYSLQTGDLSRISDGMQMFRSYYWRVTNPEDYDLPNPDREGEIWTKTANDNGDGTYDVIVSKEVAQNQTASSYVQAGESKNDTYPGAYREVVDISTNNTEQAFVSDGGTIPDAFVGQIKRIENVPLENGKFRTTLTTRTAVAQRIPPESEAGGPNYPWLEYGSDYIFDANNIIIGRNQPWSKVIEDRDRTNTGPAIFKINSMTVRVNDYGLFDYTIISNTPG